MDELYNNIWLKASRNMIDNIKDSNIPLPQLAKTVGVSERVLQNFINGKTIISITLMIKISKALNMTVNEFIGFKYL